MRSGKLVIAEGGGPTAVINQSLVGAVLGIRLWLSPLLGDVDSKYAECISGEIMVIPVSRRA